MSTAEPRGIKIDLQIRKRRENIGSPSNNKARVQLPTTKSTNHSRKLNVTVHNKQEQKKTIPQVEIKKIIISEFKINESEPSSIIFPRSLNISNARPGEGQPSQTNVCSIPKPHSSSKQWEQMQIRQKLQRSEIISQIMKKEAQIYFYEHLLKQKTAQSNQELQTRQREYQEYIESLISIFQAEVQKCKQLSKDLEDKQFEKKREAINLEGKMGLNFSPRHLSTFSGMSAGSMLLDSVQKYTPNPSQILKKKRSELFSFGSSNKQNKSHSKSNEFQAAFFLNPGRAAVHPGKKIIFE